MRYLKAIAVPAILFSITALCGGSDGIPDRDVPLGQLPWQQVLANQLPRFGQGNWIVIADGAFPALSHDGIETIVTGADQPEVLRAITSDMQEARHVRSIAFGDAELKFIPEQDAPGVTAYRQQLAAMMGDRELDVMPRQAAIKQLIDTAQTYRVLVLKTNATIPYSTVYLRLDSWNWTPDAEKRLRDAMK